MKNVSVRTCGKREDTFYDKVQKKETETTRTKHPLTELNERTHTHTSHKISNELQNHEDTYME
jgi:hypothetical protein